MKLMPMLMLMLMSMVNERGDGHGDDTETDKVSRGRDVFVSPGVRGVRLFFSFFWCSPPLLL